MHLHKQMHVKTLRGLQSKLKEQFKLHWFGKEHLIHDLALTIVCYSNSLNVSQFKSSG